MALQVVNSVVPANDLPAAPAQNAQVASSAVPANDLPAVPDSDLPDDTDGVDKNEQYGGGGQQAIAGLEGVAKGVAGPLATAAEVGLGKLGVPGLRPEDISGRAEANPWTHGIGEAAGLGGSLLTGVGEAALIGEAAETLNIGSKMGKIGSAAVKTALEAGMFQGGDEASKYILGQSDPEAPVASAMAHIGAAGLLGGVGGAVLGKAGSKLQELSKGKTAGNVSQFLADFGNRFNFLHKTPDVHGAAAEEASELWEAVSSAHDETWGNSGLKSQAIEKLVPEMGQPILKQTQEIADKVQGTLAKMAADPESFPPHLRKGLDGAVKEWMDVATSPNASSFDNFNATQELKRKLQLYSKFDKSVSAIDPARGFIDSVKGLGHDLRTALEDEKVWGDAGSLQKELNSAFSKLKPYQDDFIKTFGAKKLGIREVDPDRIGNLMRQVGRGKGELRGSKLADFIEPAQKFLERVDELHGKFGVESAYPRVSTNVLDEMLSRKTSAGAKAADLLFGGGPKSIGMAGGHAAGTAIGAIVGHPYLGYRAGEHLQPILAEGLGRKFTRWGVDGALRAMASGSHDGVPQAINYAEAIGNGTKKVNSAIDNLFTIGGQKSLNSDFSEAAREALNKYVSDGDIDQEIDNQKNKGSQKQLIRPSPSFAHGGEVIAPEPNMPVSKPVPKATSGMDHIATAFPEQGMYLGAAKTRIANYLNSKRPQKVMPKRPFDAAIPDKEHERKYNQVLDIANKPLSVLDHIKNGTLELEQVQHMNNLYPELSNHLRKKLTEKVISHQMEDHKPPHKVLQSLSLFLGSPMDSSFDQAHIAAAQTVFALQKQQGAAPAAKTNKLSKADNQYRSPDQAALARQSAKP